MGLKAAMNTGMSHAMSFAHLAGSRPRAADDNDNNGDDKPGDDDSNSARRGQRAQDDTQDTDATAQTDNGDDGNGDDDNGKPDDDSGKGKRGQRARAQDDGEEDAEDGDDDSEMRGPSAIAAARRREQARCSAIFATRAAGRNPALAAQLAFTTRLPRREAIAVLQAAPASTPYTQDRAASNPRVGPGSSPETHSRQGVLAGWDRAFAQVTPRRPR